MAVDCAQFPTLPASSVRNPAVSFAGQLASGELCTGTPTVTELGTSDLTISNESVSTTALTVQGETVAIAQAVQWAMSGFVAGTAYRVRVSCPSDASPSQTLVCVVRFVAGADT